MNEVMRGVLGRLLEREVQFPDHTLVTITRVESSPDLRSAAVFVTVYPSDASRAREVIGTLARAASAIQRALNRALRMRPVPKIVFKLDRAEAHRERVEELLSEVNRDAPH